MTGGEAFGFNAVLFDLDGVITPTADLHQRAWDSVFSNYLTAGTTAPYTSDDYFTHVDGRPRFEAVARVLHSRGIDIPHGAIDDPPNHETICGLGNRKDALFRRHLDDGIAPYPRSIAFLEHLERIGVRSAIVSSSRNARAVLRGAGLEQRFEIIVDGLVAADAGLAGKPAPDTYLYASSEIRVPPAECVVIEDATSGVAAGAAGGFGLTIGVDRGAGVHALTTAGADQVVKELDELIP